MFGHPGLSWTRVASAMSVEMTTGVYSRLPQLALTLIGSFILVLSVLRAFGCVDSILLGAGRSPRAPACAAAGGRARLVRRRHGQRQRRRQRRHHRQRDDPAMIAAGMPRATPPRSRPRPRSAAS
jgi:hypothetical protein